MGVRDAKERIERILKGEEDNRLFGNEKEENGRKDAPEEAVSKKHAVEPEKEQREWYGLHLLPEVPGMEIVRSLRIVHVFSVPENLNEESIKATLLKLKEKAIKKKANAVVNLRIAFPTPTSIYIYGEAVFLRPKEDLWKEAYEEGYNDGYFMGEMDGFHGGYAAGLNFF